MAHRRVVRMAPLSAPVRTRLPGAVRSGVRVRSAGARARAETRVRRVVHRAVRDPADGEAGAGARRRHVLRTGWKKARQRRASGLRRPCSVSTP